MLRRLYLITCGIYFNSVRSFLKLEFLSEAETMKVFDHRNIVKLLGVCTKGEPAYAVMELMIHGMK